MRMATYVTSFLQSLKQQFKRIHCVLYNVLHKGGKLALPLTRVEETLGLTACIWLRHYHLLHGI